MGQPSAFWLASAQAATARPNAGNLTKEGSWTTKLRKNI
jgi:hypothetical protein